MLEAFYRSDKHKLIFAPHVMLFRKRVQISLKPLRMDRPGRVSERYLNCAHILVDLGSEHSCDMTYTQAADFYLGDVSSQIYEFLHRPRPCAFIDSHRIAWHGDSNYRHWISGPVIDGASNLIPTIDAAHTSHAEYLQAQRGLFEYSIEIREKPSSRRSAGAILHFVRQNFPLSAESRDQLLSQPFFDARLKNIRRSVVAGPMRNH